MDADSPALGDDAMEVLLAHTWPGNVRELENCLISAAVVARGGVIHTEHLTIGAGFDSSSAPLGSLEDAERAHVLRVFTASGRHKSRTAEILGVSRPRLDRLLEKYGIA
jgi:DNA-binding NtrC family response regulator